MTDTPRFPFGQPLEATVPSATSARRIFVLGAYPSALHVAWTGVNGEKIRALPVDNEPEPFWTGADAAERIEDWKRAVGFDSGVDGTVTDPGKLNGSSGVALATNYLAHLVPGGATIADAWVTDCLNTYRMSTDVAKAIGERFERSVMESRRPNSMPMHPSEDAIVREATSGPRFDELHAELATSEPEIIVTLGNAARRVLQALLGTDSGPIPLQKDGYGGAVQVGSHTWFPLAHPGATREGRGWNATHQRWVTSRS